MKDGDQSHLDLPADGQSKARFATLASKLTTRSRSPGRSISELPGRAHTLCPIPGTTRPNSGTKLAPSPKRLKFFVQVARLRIDTAIVEVEATDHKDAERKALELVEQLPQEARTTNPFDPNVYKPHLETMIAEDEFSATDVPNRERAADFLADSETR